MAIITTSENNEISAYHNYIVALDSLYTFMQGYNPHHNMGAGFAAEFQIRMQNCERAKIKWASFVGNRAKVL